MSTFFFILTWIVVIFIWIGTKPMFDTKNPKEWLDWVTLSLAYSLVPILIGGYLMKLVE